MKFIFDILCNFSNELRKNFVLLFCKYNLNYSDFIKIPLFPKYMLWDGSEVPILENKISFLQDIKNELTELDYIEHKAYLAERIQIIQEYKEKVLLQEFIEVR
jgi:hypothetical protein